MYNRGIYIIVFIIFSTTCILAQDKIKLYPEDMVYGKIENGDTILISSISEVIIMPPRKFSSRGDYRRYLRLIRNVKRVYPYAKIAGQRYRMVEQHLLTLKTEKEQKAYLKQVEKEVINEFEDDLTKLTMTQGRILLKLIDREIGETSYDLLKEFRGSFSAIFWQALARIFGHNLKTGFDPKGEDKLLNEILILIDSGQL